MSRVAEYLFALAVTLWVGALWAIGYISAPVLFNVLSDHNLAGTIAGQQFGIVAWLGVGCALYLMGFLFAREGLAAFKTLALWLILLMFVLTLAGHFGIEPILSHLRQEAMPRQVMESVFRDRFATWHGIASVLYLIQSVLGVALVTQVFKR
ncbi:DUF4149 domain-containing protein [Uliginosibacterium gangwonense]|uniref:DUF4149 domain-containing protein n=1 Tax=Uliginosibacterium gangwonense TaxID=392736 RepID=UPI00037BCB20|nr:DUF4149 domain-containing protein [Uliginosibacterium gangwonense]